MNLRQKMPHLISYIYTHIIHSLYTHYTLIINYTLIIHPFTLIITVTYTDYTLIIHTFPVLHSKNRWVSLLSMYTHSNTLKNWLWVYYFIKNVYTPCSSACLTLRQILMELILSILTCLYFWRYLWIPRYSLTLCEVNLIR